MGLARQVEGGGFQNVWDYESATHYWAGPENGFLPVEKQWVGDFAGGGLWVPAERVDEMVKQADTYSITPATDHWPLATGLSD